jgi:hypothetical protein
MVKVDESYLFSTEKLFPSNAIKDKMSFAINRKNERCIFCQNSVTETEY